MQTGPFQILGRVTVSLAIAAASVLPAEAAIPSARALLQPSRPADLTETMIEGLVLAVRATPNRQTVDTPDRGGADFGNLSRDRNDIPLSRIMTQKIVKDLYAIRNECSNYDAVYRIDCLRRGIDMIVASLPRNSEYDDVSRILNSASRKLGRIVSRNADPGVPKLEPSPRANPRFKRRRSYTAIKRSAVPKAMEQARAVIDEAATKLLRSTENSERRYAHYQDISVAVNSTKTLLRSS